MNFVILLSPLILLLRRFSPTAPPLILHRFTPLTPYSGIILPPLPPTLSSFYRPLPATHEPDIFFLFRSGIKEKRERYKHIALDNPPHMLKFLNNFEKFFFLYFRTISEHVTCKVSNAFYSVVNFDVLQGEVLYIKEAMELYPLYAQCFLLLGMSFERWVIICRPHNVKQILRTENRLRLYTVTIFCSMTIPSLLLADIIYHKET